MHPHCFTVSPIVEPLTTLFLSFSEIKHQNRAGLATKKVAGYSSFQKREKKQDVTVFGLLLSLSLYVFEPTFPFKRVASKMYWCVYARLPLARSTGSFKYANILKVYPLDGIQRSRLYLKAPLCRINSI